MFRLGGGWTGLAPSGGSMIRINLLGDALAQTAKKVDRAEAAQVYGEGEGGSRSILPIAAIVVGLLFSSVGGIYYVVLNNEQQRKEAKRAELEQQKAELQKYIELEKKFREQKEALQKKEEVMLGLRKSQMLPVHFLEELANSIPEDIWFAEISLKGASVSIKGEARTFEAVKRFYDNLQERPRWFKNVNYPGGSRKGARVAFTISFDLLNPA